MAAKQYIRGHEVYFNYVKEEWLYSDDNTPANDKRPCPRCGHLPLPSGEDYCLGHIPGVEYACCGHGTTEGYIKLENGTIFREEIEHTKPVEFKIEYTKNDIHHTIHIQQYYNNKKVSKVSITGPNTTFKSNLENMTKICQLLNDYSKDSTDLSKIKNILERWYTL